MYGGSGSWYHAGMRQTHASRYRILVFLLVVGCFLPVAFASSLPRVLFLSSYAYDWDASRLQMQGFEESVRSNADVKWVFMDAKQLSPEESEQQTIRILQGEQFDLVVTSDDEALDFALAHQNDLFSASPIVFGGVNTLQKAESAFQLGNATGIVQTFPIAETVRLASQLYPRAQRVLAISDESPTGQGASALFRSLGDQFPSLRFEVLDGSEMDKEAFVASLGNLTDETILLFLHYSQDKNGNRYTLHQAATMISEAANVPVFRIDECTVGDGSFGGAVLSFTEMGRMTGRMALRVLGGEAPSSIPIQTMPYTYLFDEGQMRRFGIHRFWLPKNSMLVNRPVLLVARYRTVVYLLCGVVGIILVVIAVMVVLRRRHLENMRRLKESQQILEMAIKQTSMYIAELDVPHHILHVGQNMRRSLGLPDTMKHFPESLLEKGILLPAYQDSLRDGMRSIENGMPAVYMDVAFAPTNDRPESWYRMMIQTISEVDGKPDRAILIATDHTEQQKQVELFEREQNHPTLFNEKALFLLQADLTENKVLARRFFLFPDPHEKEIDQYDAFIQKADAFIFQDDHQAFLDTLSRSRLIHAFAAGDHRLSVTFRCRFAEGDYRWAKAVLSLVVHPYSKHLLLFCSVYDVNDDVDAQLLFKNVTLDTYKNLFIIDAHTGGTRRLVRNGNRQSLVVVEKIEDVAGGVDEPMDSVKQKLALDVINKELDANGRYLVSFLTKQHGRVRLTFSYLDESHLKICCLDQDVTEIVQKEAEQQQRLQAALDAAQKASATKSEFLSRMSHEMRTPISAILGLTQLGIEETHDRESRDAFRKIHESCTYLLGLINDVLDMSHIEAAKVELHPQLLTMSHFLESLDAIIQPQCQAKGVLFTTVVEGNVATEIHVDDLRFIQIFVNVLGNAVKFTPSGGSVTLELSCRDRGNPSGWLDCAVRDTGCGMTAEFLKKAFEPFTQERIGENRSIPGTGLGLAIVKYLVTLMGGSVRLESELDKGTTVFLSFPMTWVDDYDVPVRSKEMDYSMLKGKRVLLAEDHPLNAEIAARLLEKAGMVVEQAHDGAEAVRMFREGEHGRYNAILMDMHMPVMDGIKAAKEIRSLSRPDASVPIIAVTAEDSPQERERCMHAGMNGYLSKPFDQQTLYVELCSLLQGRSA